MNRLSFMTVALFLEYLTEDPSGETGNKLKAKYEKLYSDIKAAGYEYIDLSSWEADAFGLKYLLRLIREYDLKVSSYIHFESFADLEKNISECLNHSFAGVDKAAVLGSEFLMIGIRNRGGIAEKDPQKIRGQLTAYFKAVCEYAKDRKVCPVIENIPDAGLYLNKWEEVRAVMDEVPSLGYIFDSGTALIAEQESEAYLSSLKDRLVYVHLKDMTETDVPENAFPSLSGIFFANAPTGKGLVDVKTVLELLKDAGYSGRISVEFCPDADLPLDESIRRSKAYIEELL